MEGAILLTWRRPVNDVAEQALDVLHETIQYIKNLRDQSVNTSNTQAASFSQQSSQSFGRVTSSPQVSSYELQINTTGNHIGAFFIVRGEVESLLALQTDDEWRDKIMKLSVLMDDFSTNNTVGGPDDKSSKEALRTYRSAFSDIKSAQLASSGSRR